jgi:hypothetical protein
MSDQGHDLSWWEQPANIRRMKIGLIVALGLSIVYGATVDFTHLSHPHFDFETAPFFAIFGFAAYFTIVSVAKGLRVLVMRSEDYYDE